MFQCFVITLLKWVKYKNRLTFAYYSIKSLQSVSKTWQVVKAKNIFLKRCSNIKIPFFMISNPDSSLFFFRNRVVLKTPFPDDIFPKISKYRTENLLSRPPATTKPPPPRPSFLNGEKVIYDNIRKVKQQFAHRRMQFYRANFE